MAEIVFTDSEFRFTDPVRLFKANDPYFYEVDNLPLKQLQENDRWVKDQLQNFTVTDIQRSDFAELKPYVGGADNVVRVKSGRYTARINDAYGLTPMQTLTQVLGEELGVVDRWECLTSNNTTLKTILDKFKVRSIDNALGMNGLVERSFTYPAKNADEAIELDFSTATIRTKGTNRPVVMPIREVLMWFENTGQDTYLLEPYDTSDKGKGFLPLGTTESHFIKKWRGVARTAIVDVPNELTVEIPPFKTSDFFYFDSSGVKQLISGVTTRIDLLFLYSKPVDSSSTHTAKWVNNSPTQITKAELGLLKGAGLGADFESLGNIVSNFSADSAIDADGNSLMLPNVSDELDTGLGFSNLNVHGSFPAPDDLLNVTPLLSEALETDSPLLVGQSILPIAYIVTRSTDGQNESGVNILTDDSVIDIRPFFRTAELSYNERAGIAAAMPQLSLANPAVGKGQLDVEIKDLKTHADTGLAELTKVVNQQGIQKTPRTVAAGYVFGGFLFGVEGALADFYRTKLSTTSSSVLKSQIVKDSSMDESIVIPDYPQWDLSKWVQAGNFSGRGEYPNDYINTHLQEDSKYPADFGCYVNKTLTSRATFFGTDNLNVNHGQVNIHFVSKTIPIDKSEVAWMDDYLVETNLYNCVPLSCRNSPYNSNTYAGASNIWVEKKKDQFTIYVAWVASDHKQDGDEYDTLAGRKLPIDNRDNGLFAGFAVINEDISRLSNQTAAYPGEPQAGVAIYPTIYFRVVGIPKGYQGYKAGLGASQTLKLI